MRPHVNAMDAHTIPDGARFRADIFEDGSVAIIRDTASAKIRVKDERHPLAESIELSKQHHDDLVSLNMRHGKDVRFDRKTGQFFEHDLDPKPDKPDHGNRKQPQPIRSE